MTEGTGREKPRFEPPPWERERFEELAKKRAEQEEARRLAEQALAAAGGILPTAAGPTATEIAEVSGARVEAEEAAARAAVQAERHEGPAGVPAGDEAGSAPPAPAKIDDKQVAAMLSQLAAQERAATSSSRLIGRIAAAVTALIGLGMVVAGFVTLPATKSHPAAVLGSAILSVFGLGFIVMAVWVWLSASRSKGIG